MQHCPHKSCLHAAHRYLHTPGNHSYSIDDDSVTDHSSISVHFLCVLMSVKHTTVAKVRFAVECIFYAPQKQPMSFDIAQRFLDAQ